MKPNKQAVLSLSGGLDSSTLLLHLLSSGHEVQCLSFDYGQKHRIELERAQDLVNFLSVDGWAVSHKIIELKGLSELLVSGLVDNGSMELKKGHYEHENALTTVVPNRNAIMAAIAYAVALSKVKKTGEPCKIALGTHMGDFDNGKKEGIYPDCSEEFRTALEHAFKIGNWDSDKVDYYAPYNTTDKAGLLKDGLESCLLLGLDYKEIYSRTITSYTPLGECSDFKSGSSIERILAFDKNGVRDPLIYADDDGAIVSWEFVRDYALKIENEFRAQ